MSPFSGPGLLVRVPMKGPEFQSCAVDLVLCAVVIPGLDGGLCDARLPSWSCPEKLGAQTAHEKSTPIKHCWVSDALRQNDNF